MPRNGSGVYSLPPGSTFVPNTLAQSSVVNGINNDLATDLNTPRPIVAGGTGASTAQAARDNLGITPFLGGIPLVVNGRLTLTSGVPVTTADVTAATILYFTPFTGSQIWLYSSAWAAVTFTQISLSLSALTGGLPYDIYCYSNAGVATLEALGWTNGTTRATALTLQDGVYVKTGDPTRRYIGTIYTSNAGQTEDSTAKRYVWNYYNRVRRKMSVPAFSASWTYAGTTVRQAQSTPQNQLNFVIGVPEDCVEASIVSYAQSSAALQNVFIGYGLNTTTAFTSPSTLDSITSAALRGLNASDVDMPIAGVNFLAWLENTDGVATATFNRGIMQGTVIA